MKAGLFCLVLFFALSEFRGQSYLLGKVISEDEYDLADVQVINMNSNEKAMTDRSGHFMILAKEGEELRFVKKRFYREQLIIRKEHFQNLVQISLKPVPEEIEEVIIEYRATGDLDEDTKHFGKTKAEKKLDEEMAAYIKRKSRPENLRAAPGEFVQPVGPGFSIGKVRNNWTDVDLINGIIDAAGEDFFTVDLQLKPIEISHFIGYVLRDFERAEILKYGFIPPSDLSRFISLAMRKITDYRNKVPVSNKKRKRLILKN